MASSEAQQDFEQRFNAAIHKRTTTREKVKDVSASIARLKAEAAQASADVAKIRADARAAGVKLPRVAPTNGHANGGSVVPYETSDESEDDDS